MEIALLYLIAGILLLTWSTDKFILGAVQIAKNFEVSSLIIGLTVISLGTSAPEILVSVVATLKGNRDLAVANVVGSNIANMGFVLGLSAVIMPIKVKTTLLKKEYPLLFLLMLIVFIFFWDFIFSRVEGLLLLFCLVGLMMNFIYQSRSEKGDLNNDLDRMDEVNLGPLAAYVYFLGGLLLLTLGAEWVVTGASGVASYFGMSEALIGLTIVAIGTSLPEAATTIMASFKKEQDIAIGNVLGSNMFNLAVVLPCVGLISPGQIDPVIFRQDMPVMLAFSLLTWIWIYLSRGRVSRLQGSVLILFYGIYLTYRIFSAGVL